VSEIFSGIFTLNYVVSNVVWSLLLMILARILVWVRGKPLNVQRKTAFWIVSFLTTFVFISALSYAVKGPQSPELRGGFDSLTFTTLPENAAGILLVFHVGNLGTPTIVEDYSLTITPPGGSPVEGVPLFIPKALQIPVPSGSPEVFPFSIVCGKDALYRRTFDQPLTNGGLSRGILWYQVPGYSMREFANPTGTKFQMTFIDVRGKKYESEVIWGTVSKPSGYQPGLTIPKSEKPEEACD
jgi:hypothetical protein